MNVMSKGIMPTSRLLPNVLRTCLISAVAISFVESKRIKSSVAKAPSVAPVANVATVVTVVVTVDIMLSRFCIIQTVYKGFSWHQEEKDDVLYSVAKGNADYATGFQDAECEE